MEKRDELLWKVLDVLTYAVGRGDTYLARWREYLEAEGTGERTLRPGWFDGRNSHWGCTADVDGEECCAMAEYVHPEPSASNKAGLIAACAQHAEDMGVFATHKEPLSVPDAPTGGTVTAIIQSWQEAYLRADERAQATARVSAKWKALARRLREECEHGAEEAYRLVRAELAALKASIAAKASEPFVPPMPIKEYLAWKPPQEPDESASDYADRLRREWLKLAPSPSPSVPDQGAETVEGIWRLERDNRELREELSDLRRRAVQAHARCVDATKEVEGLRAELASTQKALDHALSRLVGPGNAVDAAVQAERVRCLGLVRRAAFICKDERCAHVVCGIIRRLEDGVGTPAPVSQPGATPVSQLGNERHDTVNHCPSRHWFEERCHLKVGH